jgi:hypothetical protein
MPFDVQAEGLLLKNSRGDWTAIELFFRRHPGLESWVRRIVGRELPGY